MIQLYEGKLSMIDAHDAELLARQKVKEIADTSKNDFSLQLEKTIRCSSGWVFFYNSLEFIQTGNPIHMLAGNGPIFVTKSGDVKVLPTHTPWADLIP